MEGSKDFCMKNIGEILICLTIPLQISLMPGIILSDGPFCYYGSLPSPFPELYNIPSVEVTLCSWEISAFFESYSVLPVTIITLPVMLAVFLIHYVKNRRRV